MSNLPTSQPKFTREPLTGSKSYLDVDGLKVPMREVALTDTKLADGQFEKNAPVRLYDCSALIPTLTLR